MINSVKKQYLLILMAILFVVTFNGIVHAYLIDNSIEVGNLPVGKVDIEVEAYYVKDGNKYGEKELGDKKITVYSKKDELDNKIYFYALNINISNPDSINYVKNLRIDFTIHSTVESYFRVGLFESIVFTYENGGNTYETSRTQKFLNFKYNNGYFDNRIKDNYFYYKTIVKKINNQAPTIRFMEDIIGDIGFYDDRYFLRVGIMFEAVQAHEGQGPRNNWSLDTKPWGGEW